jgi:ABC-type transport system involved in cytochrome bd biosynthesis fused ATPase/permease subunit
VLDALDRELFEMIENERSQQRPPRRRQAAQAALVGGLVVVVIALAAIAASWGWLRAIGAAYAISWLSMAAFVVADHRRRRAEDKTAEPQ